MNPKINYLYFIVAIFLIVVSCNDFIEKELDDKFVIITSPQDSFKTEVLTHVFWWEEIEGALKYNIQIVSPSFSNVQELVLDSNLTKTQFQTTLHPGTFQWRVRAYNGSSTTPYTTYTLVIDSSANLTSQQVVLLTPTLNYATNNITQVFKWYELYNANDYRFEIRSPDWNGQLVYNPEIIEGSEISLTLNEGFYEWGVQAQNNSSSSAFTTRKLIIDLTNPVSPTLVSPSNGDTLTATTANFKWKRGINTGSAISDSFYIASDTGFTNIKVNALVADTTYTWTSVQNGTYYWKVKSIDAAGNKSGYSSRFKFYQSTTK